MIPSPFLAGLLVVVTLVSGTVPESSASQRQGGGRKKFEPAVPLPADFVRIARVPDGGLQPRVAAAADSRALLYFKGDELHGDLFLTRSKDGHKPFEPGAQVNPVPGAVLAQEAGDSGSIGLGPDGRAHVAWVSGGETPALQYVCEGADGALTAVQDLGSPARLLPATAVALDPHGKVYVFFAAEDATPVEGEAPGLRVWMRTSADGASFSPAVAIDAQADGVTESSTFAAHVDRVRGTVFVFYVSVGRKFAPEVRLLSSADGGGKFASKKVELLPRQNTPIRAQLHLSQEIATERTVGGPRTIMSWDCYGRVLWGAIDPTSNKLQGSIPIEPRVDGEPSRRFRAQGASNGTEFLLAWLEHPVGDRSAPPVVCWEVWYSDGLLPLGSGRIPASPVASAPAVIANAGPGFTLVY